MDEQTKKLAEIERTLKEIHKVIKPTRWQLFVQGFWRAIGYLIGLVLAVAIIGWLLNIIGLIPFMTEFSENLKDVLNIARSQ